MATYRRSGGETVDAFRWHGGLLTDGDRPGWAKELTGRVETLEDDGKVRTVRDALPPWTRNLALHTPGDGTLQVPTPDGTLTAAPGDWVVREADGTLSVMSGADFAARYEDAGAEPKGKEPTSEQQSDEKAASAFHAPESTEANAAETDAKEHAAHPRSNYRGPNGKPSPRPSPDGQFDRR